MSNWESNTLTESRKPRLLAGAFSKLLRIDS